jgi:hypothetical protein
MPVSPTYPGVYIEELPSGVRTITGVATSITAFVGWAARGPTDRATLVLSWADFERKFGGLDGRGLLGYAVSHYFANGGRRAYIVRLARAVAPAAAATVEAKSAAATLDGKLKFTATSPGEWANDYAVATKKRAAPDDKRFQLRVLKTKENGKDLDKPITIEAFDNLSMDPGDRRYVVSVLAEESAVIKAELVGAPAEPPKDTIPVPPDPAAGKVPEEAKLKDGLAGTPLAPDQADFADAVKQGVKLLDRIDLFNLLCVPGETDETVSRRAAAVLS